MMQLLCDGVFLDLLEGTSIQFKKDNVLFGFDSISCERTTEISIPSTPKNDGVFGLAKVPAYNGAGMRVKYNATLMDGVVVKSGYLYISSYADGAYKAIFVTGELVGLQAIKDAGKVSGLITPADSVAWDTNSYDKAANASNVQNFDIVSYNAENPVGWHKEKQVNPSYSLQYVLTQALARINRTATLPEEAQKVRIILGEPKGASGNIRFSQVVIDSSQPSATQPSRPYNSASATGLTRVVGNDTSMLTSYRVVSGGYDVKYYRLNQFKALADLNLTFQDNTPNNTFLVSFGVQGAVFLGDYSFTKTQSSVTTTGEPLAGRTINIPVGTLFLMVTPDDYVNESDGSTSTIGWRFQSFPLTHTAEAKTNITDGSVVRLQDNLPELTIVELLKVCAAVSGKVLNYEDGITFDSLNFDLWPVLKLDGSIISRGTLTRTFSDYAQKNKIEFKSDDSVLDSEKATLSYTITNANITDEKVLQTIPFSEGGAIVGRQGEKYLYMRNGDKNSDTISMADGPNVLMRASLLTNAGISQLCSTSTTIIVNARMVLMEFDSLKPKTIILHEGSRYVWTSATWSNNVANITLSKI